MGKPYNPKDPKSIITYAKALEGKTLSLVCEPEVSGNQYGGKGNFGQLLEKYYFGYEVNSVSAPDFEEAGIELKSTPLRTLKNGVMKSKERLVLGIINYLDIVDEDFETSALFTKNKHLLLVFYLWSKELDELSYPIKIVGDWQFPEEDLAIIRSDWETIQNKVKEGKAHELSEGDTLYLGAATKGPTAAKSLRDQPNNTIKAKQRAYSLKSGYINHIVGTLGKSKPGDYGSIIPKRTLKTKSFEDVVLSIVKPYLGKTKSYFCEKFEINNCSTDNKALYAHISKRILGVQKDTFIEEFEKANIEVKSIRVEENGNIIQSVSFPSFHFIDFTDLEWDDSDLKERVEKKYLFFFYTQKGEQRILESVKFWNMPYEDREEARRVWEKTKSIILNGGIFKEYQKKRDGSIQTTRKGHKIRKNNLPKISESKVCHVRPHGKDASATYPLPVADKILGVTEYSKQCFWINATYVRDEIYAKSN